MHGTVVTIISSIAVEFLGSKVLSLLLTIFSVQQYSHIQTTLLDEDSGAPHASHFKTAI